MAHIYLVVGSVTGTAQSVADILKADIEAAGHSVLVDSKASLKTLDTQAETQNWDALLVCTSSTGKGQIPGNLQPFYQSLVDTKPDLSTYRYGIIALGDSTFARFCGGAELIENQLNELKAQCLVPKITIDATETMTPARDAKFWLREFLTEL